MTKEQLYQHFGPKLIDALAQVMLDEINLLRTEHELPLRNAQQVVDAIADKLENIPHYDWMNITWESLFEGE